MEVGVREFRNHLSRWLEAVRSGEERSDDMAKSPRKARQAGLRGWRSGGIGVRKTLRRQGIARVRCAPGHVRLRPLIAESAPGELFAAVSAFSTETVAP